MIQQAQFLHTAGLSVDNNLAQWKSIEKAAYVMMGVGIGRAAVAEFSPQVMAAIAANPASWNQFRSALAGKGYSMGELGKMWTQYQNSGGSITSLPPTAQGALLTRGPAMTKAISNPTVVEGAAKGVIDAASGFSGATPPTTPGDALGTGARAVTDKIGVTQPDQ